MIPSFEDDAKVEFTTSDGFVYSISKTDPPILTLKANLSQIDSAWSAETWQEAKALFVNAG